MKKILCFAYGSKYDLYWLIRGGFDQVQAHSAVLKTAGRKAMQVRVLSPPPFTPPKS